MTDRPDTPSPSALRHLVAQVALLLTLASACGSPPVEPEAPPRSTAVAPAAAIVRAARPHFDVVDARATLAPWACLDAPHAGDVSIVVELQDAGVKGAVLLTDSSGEVLTAEPIREGEGIVEILATVPAGRRERCISIRAVEGASVFELRWRYRE